MTDYDGLSAAQRAEAFLWRYLPPDGVPVPSADVQTAAAAETPPIPARTLQRAAKAIGVHVGQMSDARGRTTLWTAPRPTVAEPTPTSTDKTPTEAAPHVRKGELGRAARGVLNHMHPKPYPRTRGTHQ